jgi:Protein of unknown function (DUF3311)
MSSNPAPPANPSHRQPLPTGTRVIAGLLVLIPLVALALVPTYAKSDPHLWGFPFFYWYQFLWVFLASGCTFGAYVVLERARRGGER